MTQSQAVKSPNASGLKMIDFQQLFSAEQLEQIKQVETFRDSQYVVLDIPATLDYFTRRFVCQLPDFSEINQQTVIADVGTGYGWMAMALAFTTDAKIIAVEPDGARLMAGKKIAEILGIAEHIEWQVAPLGKLPMADRSIDIVYCIEVLEHIYHDPTGIPDLCRISRDLIILTTPNLWFPIIAHDTELPFCHWLPIPLREVYAKLFGRVGGTTENDNLFWSPFSLKRQMPGFKPVSNWLHYISYQKYLDAFPYYLPYGDEPEVVAGPGRWKGLYYGLVSKLGSLGRYIIPSLSYVMKRQQNKK
ncbi:class I SAM-dependent methyltransferase [Candidatus Venteria ishoeyi]|uniref:tRNA (Mo5U34)-methyltransferase n=1 Tax=Candidatus Venteria ishoeyi TaxID=1899563 RepID=A0A1H6F5J2_9GAMM|nr:class I SAM-dependent methyltransferase [Candidatus Venteria ishoeyi]MDM8546232.1 class I SAM-dependent methyltransferase [Candidatus Venteria ishoeyi]SEH04346.1 tRNA (mo5U34)-methyltransferase [Candidatus Venteria ishoeyi]